MALVNYGGDSDSDDDKLSEVVINRSMSIVGMNYDDDEDDDSKEMERRLSGNFGSNVWVHKSPKPSSDVWLAKALPSPARPKTPKDDGTVLGMSLLPPEPDGVVDPQVQEKIRVFLSWPDVRFNDSLLKMKEFHNPSMMAKICSEFKIVPQGTNYPKEIFNPEMFKAGGKFDYEVIDQEQKRSQQRKAEATSKARENPLTARVDFREGKSLAPEESGEAKRRRSGWDQSSEKANDAPASDSAADNFLRAQAVAQNLQTLAALRSIAGGLGPIPAALAQAQAHAQAISSKLGDKRKAESVASDDAKKQKLV